MEYVALFGIYLGNVAVRAFQQINVTLWHPWRVPPTSALFAFFDMLSIGYTADLYIHGGSLWLIWLAFWSAGTIGCLFSMHLSRWLRRRAHDASR